ncbi:hypothetical protein [Nocardia sp. bgisy134]|uniref:hypothetical protein n=1 Tax=unclassified Nocardia TaxID=2637762 RepID=UPI003D72F4F1
MCRTTDFIKIEVAGALSRRRPKTVNGDTVTPTWTLNSTGAHVLTAKLVVGDYEETSLTIQVGNGINVGSACLVQ